MNAESLTRDCTMTYVIVIKGMSSQGKPIARKRGLYYMLIPPCNVNPNSGPVTFKKSDEFPITHIIMRIFVY